MFHRKDGYRLDGYYVDGYNTNIFYVIQHNVNKWFLGHTDGNFATMGYGLSDGYHGVDWYGKSKDAYADGYLSILDGYRFSAYTPLQKHAYRLPSNDVALALLSALGIQENRVEIRKIAPVNYTYDFRLMKQKERLARKAKK